MTEVSVRELKARLSEYIRRSEAGEHILVTRRGKAVSAMGPPPRANTPSPDLRAKLLELQARGIVAHVGSGKPGALHPRVKLKGKGPTVSEMILEDRR